MAQKYLLLVMNVEPKKSQQAAVPQRAVIDFVNVLPVDTAEVERVFSFINQIKTIFVVTGNFEINTSVKI
ncbi:hypothetical protein QR680_008648 [Steinernema hermaphroditum]|uniref:Uncharacterized protein n=1 Tax=Steinernema hermaphroditum TaxID=289476 RepID=A0AA39M8E6_9BILA|nr:hypothetical protein QR680_008648 [Steinernema hermaphroditum]